MLDAVELPPRYRSHASKLRRGISAKGASTDFKPLIGELAGLIGQALGPSADEPEARAPLLNKLFSKRGEETAGHEALYRAKEEGRDCCRIEVWS